MRTAEKVEKSLTPTILSYCFLFLGILFAVHPIHCEAVAGVVGRADVLATLFCFLGKR